MSLIAMKKIFRYLLVFFVIGYAFIESISAQYCYPNTVQNPDYGGYNFYIDRVRLGDIDNRDLTSPDVTANDDYSQYGPWTNLTRGSAYSLKINAGPSPTWYASLYYAAWIDFNNDGDFSDAGEKLGQYKTVIANEEFNINFTVPASASVSLTRMRVRCTYSSTSITVDPCATYTFGETEDYIVGLTDFLKTTTSISGAGDYNASFFNLDGDSDYDLLALNEMNEASPVNFYSNNGSGVFTANAYINTVTPAFIDYNLSYTLCDLNNDNGIDILLTSRYDGLYPRTLYLQKNGIKLYQTTTEIADLMRGSTEAADFNNDGRQDIIICGVGADNLPHTYIYSNTASGFVLVNDKLKAVRGHISVADYDNDNDVDILITGQDRYGNYNASLYRNDNNWKFTEIFTNLYKRVDIYGSKPQFADFNDDGLLDILCAKVYRNDGNNVFTEIAFDEGYDPLNTLKMYDINNDGKIEMLGRFEKGISIHKYNGVDSFLIDQVIIDSYMGFIDIADVNGDRKQDIFSNNYPSAFIFRNQISVTNNPPDAPPELTSSIGDSGFYSVTLKWKAGNDDKTPKKGLTYNLRVGTSSGGNQIFSSMTGSSTNNPLLKPGMGNVYNNTSWFLKDLNPGTYFWSVQTVDNSGLASVFSTEKQFTILAPLTLYPFTVPGRIIAAGAGADFDGDNDIDLIIKDAQTLIYEQTASLTYTPRTIKPNTDIICIQDLNNDNLPDIIARHTKIFGVETYDSLSLLINNGNFTFSVINLDTLSLSNVAAADFDNDGDIDILVHSNGYFLFECTDYLQYTRKKLPMPEILFNSSISPIDIDQDNDIDFIISGMESNSSTSKCYTSIYKNTGNNSFVKSQSIIPGIGPSRFQATGFFQYTAPADITWNDFNFDGYPDLLITGDDEFRNNTNQIFLNDGTGYLLATSLSPRPADKYSSTWVDFNTDGYLDLLLPKAGFIVDNFIYLNNNNTSYSGFANSIDDLTLAAYLKAIDIDNDKDKDIVCTFKIPAGDAFKTETKIYINNSNFVNQAPRPPSSTSHQIDVFDVVLNWNKGWDKLTENDGLSYNIWVGTANNKADIVSPMADLTTGYRYIENLGNVGTNTSWRLKNLPLGTYYWSVQAIDNSLTPSSWTPVQTFTLSALTASFSNDEVCLGFETQLSDNSVTTHPITSWKWVIGGKTVSTDKNPVFRFKTSGNNTVKLVVESSATKDSITKNVFVKPVPEAAFTNNTVCAGSATTFTNVTSLNGLNIVEWHWDFGDNSGSNVQNPGTHGYLIAETYNAILVAVADNGCSDTTRKSVDVGLIPTASITLNRPPDFCSGDSVQLTNSFTDTYIYRWQVGGNDITGATLNTYTAKLTGSYTVKVTNPVGSCFSVSSPVNVSVKKSPAKPIINSEGYSKGMCLGENSLKLTVENVVPGYSYQWYKNETPLSSAVSIDVMESGNYYLEASVDICTSARDNVDIEFDQALAKPVIIPRGPTVWLLSTTSKANKYNWYFNGSLIPDATGSSYIAGQNLGIYRLAIANEKGCFSFSDTLQIPLGITGIDDTDPFEGVKIYPNPTPGMFTIEMNNNIFGELFIDILSQNGRKILNIKFEKSTGHFQSQIDLSGQSKGLYILNLSLDKFRAVRKVMVE